MVEKGLVLQIKIGLNSSQLFSSPDFPENCKWTKREESWGATLTIKWLGQCRACAQPGRVQTISLPHDCSSSPDLHYCVPLYAFLDHNEIESLHFIFALFKCLSTFFHVGSLLSGAVCTFHQQTKSTILHAHCLPGKVVWCPSNLN